MVQNVGCFDWFMVFNANFNNISAMSWRSVLLVEETGDPRRKPLTCHLQTLSHNVASSTPRLMGFKLTTSVVIGTDCIGTIPSRPWRPPRMLVFNNSLNYIMSLASSKVHKNHVVLTLCGSMLKPFVVILATFSNWNSPF
jgi:hypothetical protein